MGIKRKGLSDALFTATQRRVLGLLFGNPDRSYYVNEILRFADMGIGAVQRELESLEAAGLLNVTKIGNQKHYQANRQSPIFEELRAIVIKAFGVADVLRVALASLAGHVQAAFIYGSVAKGTDTASSDIDVMVVGHDISCPDVIGALEESEKALGRAINPTLYNRQELQRKLAAGNAFLNRVFKQPRIFLIGSDDDIKASR
ncbi:MAG: nucleotidyltransferase domain-containing protein [Gammaproteobacteria bacterium]|nr:nucleotidyltransferase domain-containing protein [Gammaproteobacteria bacterium]